VQRQRPTLAVCLATTEKNGTISSHVEHTLFLLPRRLVNVEANGRRRSPVCGGATTTANDNCWLCNVGLGYHAAPRFFHARLGTIGNNSNKGDVLIGQMLSFIIPAYNEEFELGRTIAAIRTAAEEVRKPYEIVVVDDASTDATAAIARNEGVKLVRINRRQIAAARNAGVNVARGEILFFVDADTRISAVHVNDALAALQAGYAGGSARVSIEGSIPRWARACVSLFSIVYFANNLGAGAFLFTTRENFARAGGFDEQFFIGEEVFFSMALKKIGRFKLLPVPVVTSGRKLRMYSGRQILGRSIWILLRGPRGARTRRNLDIWYDGKRENSTN